MKSKGRQRTRLVAGTCFSLLMAAAPVLLPLRAQVAAENTVALEPGTCPVVRNGQVVALDWNPAFEHPGAVTGMSEFRLDFGRAEDKERLPRTPFPLHLVARMRGSDSGPEIVAGENGTYGLRFHARLTSLPAGEYRLWRAEAHPLIDPTYAGETPVMTNSPLRYQFCLKVLPVSARGAGSTE